MANSFHNISILGELITQKSGSEGMSSVRKKCECFSQTFPPTQLRETPPSSAASFLYGFCDFGFYSGVCWVAHIPLLFPGGIGDDSRDGGGGRETVSSPETSLEQERFLHVHRLWKEVTITEVMLEWPEVADILNSKLTKSLIFR